MASQNFTSIKQTSSHQVVLSPNTAEKKNMSPYAKLLMDLTNGLSDSEFSQMRLALHVDDHIKPWRQRDIQNVSDLLLLMDQKKIISRNNLKMLHDLLKSIVREDLRAKVETYESLYLGSFQSNSRNLPIPCVSSEKENSEKVINCNHDNASYEEDDLPGSQESMQSLSDDEKLFRAGIAFPEKLCLTDLEDVNMSSQGSN